MGSSMMASMSMNWREHTPDAHDATGYSPDKKKPMHTSDRAATTCGGGRSRPRFHELMALQEELHESMSEAEMLKRALQASIQQESRRRSRMMMGGMSR
jgi:hypothetical protein